MAGVADVDEAIRSRKTVKVLAEESLPLPGKSTEAVLEEMLALAGMAPFHRACDASHREGALAGIEPWRFHVLPARECRALAPKFSPEKAGKIPKMLAAADALILVTWLPNPAPASSDLLYDPSLANMEHIAAASAAIQNLLIAATARGIANYWSSGGVLRDPEQLQDLGISAAEILLGAIFLFPDQTGSSEVVESKLRPKRCPAEAWTRIIELPSADS